MSESTDRRSILVLSSKRAFEALVGPIPKADRHRFRFAKPRPRTPVRADPRDCRLVISKSYTRPEANRCILAARRTGIPTLLLVDGPLEWANLYANPGVERLGAGVMGLYEPIVHDAVATIGEAQSAWLEARNARRGVTFFEYANRRIRTAPLRKGIDDAYEFDFLLTTARTPCFDAHEARDLEAMLVRCSGALERSGFRTLVRVSDDGLRRAIRSSAPSARFETKGRFVDALARCRCVLATPSSVLLEAMHHDRATGLLDFRGRPLFYDCGWHLRMDAGAVSEWDETFDSMLAHDAGPMAFQRETLRKNVSASDFHALCERIVRGEIVVRPRPFDPRDLEFEAGLEAPRVESKPRWFSPRRPRGLGGSFRRSPPHPPA